MVSMSPSSGSGLIGQVAAVAMSAEVVDCGDGGVRAATLRSASAGARSVGAEREVGARGCNLHCVDSMSGGGAGRINVA